MSKNTRLNAVSVVLFMAAICLVCVGGTHTPWDGTAWDITSPDIDQLIGNHYKEMFDLRKGVAIRMNKEHETLATASAGGVHKQGSARAFFQDAAPTTQINGDAWDSGDTGSLWFDTNSSPDNLVYVLTNHASTGTWTLLSVSMTAEIVAAAHQWADTQTFDVTIAANGGVTLGVGDDLIGSATSAINMNNFDVDEAGVGTIGTSFNIAGTIAITGTLDEDDMASDSAVSVATQQSIKAHDAFGAFTNQDDDTNAMLVAHAYLANQDGFVSVVHTANAAADIVVGYVDTDNNPAAGGTVLAGINARTGGAVESRMFPVASGKYFEITNSAGATAIYWQPKSGALVKCTDQEAP